VTTDAPDEGAPGVRTELSRDLTLFHITMMGVGMMIGAGVFVGMAPTIAKAGPGGVLLTFALSGLVALFTAMGYAELASAVPHAGGAYNYTRIAFGQGVSFLAGWMEWFASAVAGGLYAIAFGAYTVHFVQVLGLIPEHSPHLFWYRRIVAVAVALLFIVINYRGVSETGKTGALITLGQTVTLAFIALAGLAAAVIRPSRMQNFQPFLPDGAPVLLVTMGLIYGACEGFEVIAQAGDETINPRRNLPKAMLYSVGIVTVTYVGVGIAMVVATAGVEGSLQHWFARHGETAFADAVRRLLPGVGPWLVTSAVIFASTSALNATIFSATRVSYALGRDRMLPACLARISEKRKVPHVALFASGAIILTVSALLPVRHVAAGASIMFLLLFFVVNLSVIRIRRHLGDELTYGYVMPLFPLFPIVAIVLQPVLAAHVFVESPLAWGICGAWLAAAAVIYFTYSRSRAVERPERIVTFEEVDEGAHAAYRILLPVANPDSAVRMIQAAIAIAQAKDGELDILHMVPIPEQAPLSDAEQYMQEGREAVVEAVLYASVNVPANRSVRYCRNAARGIVSAAREKRSNLIVLGWRGASYRREFVLGSTIDPVLERAPSDVAVLKDCSRRHYERVLVPVRGGPNLGLVLELADIFAVPGTGQVTLLNVRRPGERTRGAARSLQVILQAVGDGRDRFVVKFAESDRVADAIVEEAKRHDLVIMGASAESRWRRMVLGTLPEDVARRCNMPFIMARAAGRIESFIRRWF